MSKTTSARVIAVGTLKGGVAKTRLAMLMALFLAVVKGLRVLVIDADSISQTAYDWQKGFLAAAAASGLDASQVEWPIEVERHPFDDVDEVIDGHLDDFDVIVVDVGGGNRAVFEAVLSRAMMLLVPVGADGSEIDRLPATWKSAKAAASSNTAGGFEAYVVLSRTDHNTTLPREARRELLEAGYPLCDTELVKRVAYQRAYKTVPRDFLDVPALLVEVGLIEKEAA